MYEPSSGIFKRAAMAVLLSTSGLVTQAHAAPWQLELTPPKWGQPEGTLTHKTSLTPDGLSFSILNTPQHRNSMIWSYDAGGQKLDGYNYCLVTYRAEGLGRGLDPSRKIGVVSIAGQDKDGASKNFPILDLSKVILDGREHTVLLRTPLPTVANSVKVELTTDNSYGKVTIKRLEFLEKIPQSAGELKIQSDWNVPGFADSSFKSISLKDQFNDSIRTLYTRQVDDDGAAYGGALDVPTGVVTIDGIPFVTGPSTRNLVRPAEDASAMDIKVKVFGEVVTRKDFLPPSRNDATKIPVNARGSELYLLLQNEASSTHSMGVTPIPFRVPDIESFAVHLHYADGTTDLAFPWSPSDAAFTIQRTLGSYAVPLDSKKVLKSVTLLNREWKKNVCVAAVTLNTSEKQLFAAAWKAPAPMKNAPLVVPKASPSYAKREGDKVVLGNAYYEVTADFSNGFALTNLRNLCNTTTQIKLDPTSGLELTVDGKILTGLDFKVSDLQVTGASVLAKLVPKDPKIPVNLDVRLTATTNEELQTNCNMVPTGGAKTSLQFPLLKGMSIGAHDDTWYFFPHCGNALTNTRGWYRHVNSEGYSVQFMDAFNPNENIGVGLMTRNPQSAMLEYGGSRNESGVTQYIKYDSVQLSLDHLRGKLTGMSTEESTVAGELPASTEPLKTVTTSLVFHSGDWRRSAKIYTDWLATWYKPVNSQNKEWWQNTWLIGCLWASDYISRKDLKLPPVLDKKTGKYYIDEANAADLAYMGAKPDGYHFYQWVYDDQKKLQLYNETAENLYKRVGGLPASQKMVQDFHKKDQFVSMYFVPDRYGLSTQMAKQLDQKKIAMRDPAGNYLIWDGGGSGNADTIASCSESEEWLEYVAQNSNKLIRDMKVDSVYFDVFPFYRASCFAPNHGHKIPSNPNASSLKLLKRVKELYPPNTTFWTEYLPADVNSQYIDGTLSYSATTTALILSPRWDEPDDHPALLKPEIDIARYTMPHLKQYCLPQGYGLGWTVMKQMLFNGKGLFGGSWRQWDDDVSKLLGEQIRLLRKYNDCFNSDKPEHLIPTLRGDVYANKFPAKNRTLWTVMNASGITIRDNVIAVEHKPNARYYNAANGQKLGYTVRDNKAYINMKLDPQSVSCVLQTLPQAK
jgi:hypothetical protein